MYLLSQIYLQEEDWMDNIINLERLVREYPDSPYLSEALYGLCLSYFKKDEYEKAIKVGEKYLKDYSSLKYGDDILYTKAVCWEMLENQEKAIFDYQDLISKFPQSPYVEKAQERLEVLQKE
jgi:outer membrane protein assembly factor BamD (BamD/ComL family)